MQIRKFVNIATSLILSTAMLSTSLTSCHRGGDGISNAHPRNGNANASDSKIKPNAPILNQEDFDKSQAKINELNNKINQMEKEMAETKSQYFEAFKVQVGGFSSLLKSIIGTIAVQSKYISKVKSEL